jgi:hypothetical protein
VPVEVGRLAVAVAMIHAAVGGASWLPAVAAAGIAVAASLWLMTLRSDAQPTA